ncbi:hypothetical protein Taro_055250 [Colocasia esculenta]|uniref:Protein TILLER ANGLE CONTROL 1 n=1 Tax=Colocasia esculenta TaxID=4460 RepID=A0A843XT24_COLES|nr:hypothetical protein [Colocasia esculenta]
MKIFYWLHRRLHTNMEYCRVPHHKDIYVDDSTGADHGAKKAGTDKEALLLDPNVTSIQHVLDGILTIGTLGHLDGHCSAAGVPQVFPSGISALTEAEVGEEEKGLPVELAPSAEQLMPHRPSTIESFRKEMAPVEDADVKNNNVVQVATVADEEKLLLEPLLGEIVQVDKRERVTLADLLAAEHLHSKKVEPTSQAASASANAELEKAVKGGAPKMTVVGASLTCSTKHSQALNKKLGPWKKGKEEYSPPATGKLHQRLRRMLKKKIHPEMARDVQAARGGEQECRPQIMTAKYDASATVSRARTKATTTDHVYYLLRRHTGMQRSFQKVGSVRSYSCVL